MKQNGLETLNIKLEPEVFEHVLYGQNQPLFTLIRFKFAYNQEIKMHSERGSRETKVLLDVVEDGKQEHDPKWLTHVI